MKELVTVVRFRDLSQAELARGKLESEGISAFLANQYLVGVNWSYSFAVGKVKLQVALEDAAEAQLILAGDHSTAIADSETTGPRYDREDSCPSCSSTQLKQIKLGRKSAAISMLLNLPILFWGTRLICQRCGHAWRAAGSREPFPDIPAAVDVDHLDSSSMGQNERTWRDDVPWAILIVMVLMTLGMLYE